jgi:hypothetical protein
MAPSPNKDDTEIRFTAHTPERRRRPTSVTAACGCCCCCCCCLHTIGGLVGAISGSLLAVRPRPRPVDPSFPFPFRRDEIDQDEGTFPVAVVYWLLVLLGVGLVSVYYFITGSTGGTLDPNNLFIGALIALFFLPLVQVGASVLALVVAAVFYTDKASAMIRVGKITLWSVVGTVVGILIMLGMCGGFSLVGKYFQ